MAAYGGVVADALARAPSHVVAFVPGAALGAVLLLVALVFRGRGLGVALFLAGATYVAAIVAAGPGRRDRAARRGAAPALRRAVGVVARRAARGSAPSAGSRRRGAAVATLALAGLAVATLVVALSAVPPNHGLGWTVLGAIAAVGAAGTGVWVARR